MDYQIIYCKRRTLCLQIKSDLSIIVRSPKGVNKRIIEDFVNKHLDWISKKREQISARPNYDEVSKDEVKRLKQRALEIVLPRVEHYSKIMGVFPTHISITSAKKRLGSCSSNGNINFSFRLVYYSQDVIDYIVVHELAHLKEMNHSAKFWRIVEQFLPDYKERKKKI